MWTRYFFYRNESLKTTWTFRLASVSGLVVVLCLTRGFWIPAISGSLVCAEQIRGTDAILIENLDVDYLPFERAATLQREGFSSRILVPIEAGSDSEESRVAGGIVELMTRIARLRDWETISIQDVEPISLNAAGQVRDFLVKEQVRSVMIVTPGFRSRRSSLIYGAVLTPAGISVSCVPVFGRRTPATWTDTWHGIQEVTLQLFKLQYYRFWILPWQAWKKAVRR
jgi:hypothetical protein